MSGPGANDPSSAYPYGGGPGDAPPPPSSTGGGATYRYTIEEQPVPADPGYIYANVSPVGDAPVHQVTAEEWAAAADDGPPPIVAGPFEPGVYLVLASIQAGYTDSPDTFEVDADPLAGSSPTAVVVTRPPSRGSGYLELVETDHVVFSAYVSGGTDVTVGANKITVVKVA